MLSPRIGLSGRGGNFKTEVRVLVVQQLLGDLFGCAWLE